MIINETFKQRLSRLFSVMIPILITQTAIMAMNFFDSAMSGHAGAVDLAGTSIGGNIWMPVFVATNGVLLGAMPIVAHLLGADKRENIGNVIRHTMLLAGIFSVCIIIIGTLFLDTLLTHLNLEPQVHYIAKMYMAAIAVGILPFFMSTSLRALIDTLGYTSITMKIYLLALPVNAFLNYCFIFGKLGMPNLGGVGAGVATGITYWLEFFIFVWIVKTMPAFSEFKIFKEKFQLDLKQIKENLSIGIPIGLAMFMESSIFGVVALFIAKFGTVIIAAHQAALGFTSLLYMVPLSFSMALTILVGVEVGAKRFDEAQKYSRMGILINISIAIVLATLMYNNRPYIAMLYTTDPLIIEKVVGFLFYAIFFQLFDAAAAPIQGILRGYKDVKATFYSGFFAYWVVCLPLGCFLDFVMGHGPAAYWQSLDIGLFFSAVFLSLRMIWLQRKLAKEHPMLPVNIAE